MVYRPYVQCDGGDLVSEQQAGDFKHQLADAYKGWQARYDLDRGIIGRIDVEQEPDPSNRVKVIWPHPRGGQVERYGWIVWEEPK